jgi:hypothetical protein
MTTIVPLSKTTHADLKLGPWENLNEYRNQYLLPIYGLEISVLARRYPIVISRLNNDQPYGLSILCSLGENSSNGWITPDGKWLGPHVPACIQQQPFNMFLSKDGEKLMYIDTDSPLLGTEGRSLIEDGEPTEFLIEMTKYLDRLFENGKMTQAILDLLSDLDLIVPLKINIKGADGAISSLPGIFRIDEVKLNETDDETWLNLKNHDAISLIYGHLLSLGNIAKLVDVSKANNQLHEMANAESLDSLFSADNDNLNFDNLAH